MKLELKHLAGYLPYGLKVYRENKSIKSQIFIIKGATNENVFTCENGLSVIDIRKIKPILRPLSDLINEDTIAIHRLGSIELELINIEEWTEELIHEIRTGQKFKLSQFEYLFSKHFDIHGLIPAELAIDINAL